MLTLTYIALAVLGAGYLLISVFLGHGTDLGGDGAHGDGGADAAHGDGAEMSYGVEGGGHGTATAHGHGVGDFHFPFFSPLALATLFACVGGYGLVAKYGFQATDGASILAAIPAAFVTAYIITYAGWRIMASSRGSSQIRTQDLAGSPAEVITPIPAGGVGEVAALVGGQRFTAPARSDGGEEIARGTHVTVLRMVGTTLLVKRG
jgi:membrane protein implicated in regulation of membrane protease activity